MGFYYCLPVVEKCLEKCLPGGYIESSNASVRDFMLQSVKINLHKSC